MKATRTFDEIKTLLGNRKSASNKSAGTVPAAPEQDPTSQGTVAAPSNPAPKDNMPASSTNSNTTPNPAAPAVARTVEGEEPASINMKIATAVKNIKAFNSTVRAAVVKRAEAEGKTAPAESGKPAPEKDPADKGKAKVKSDDVQGVPTGEVENTDSKKEASEFSLDPSFHLKLASEILSTTEGRQYAESVLMRSLGAEAAADIVKAAAIMDQAAYEAQQQEAELAEYQASGAYQAEQLWKSASVNEQQSIIKMAQVHEVAKSIYTDDLGEFADICKQAYDAGAEACAVMLDKSAAALPEGAQAGELPEGAPGEEAGETEAEQESEETTPEDILAVLEELVQSGQISEEVAQEILQQLVGGEQGGEGAENAAPTEVPPEVAETVVKGASIVAKLSA